MTRRARGSRRPLGAGVVAAALTAGLIAAPGPARAELRALVVGINAYQAIPTLNGALNDAAVIRQALQAQGVEDLVVLTDTQATREAVIKAWEDMIARAAPDDLLFFSYAGHGGQEPERQAGSEEDGKDENLLLVGFDVTAPANAQRILDDEMNDLLAKAKPRRVIFVADSCHSGTVTRAFDPRAGQHKTRFTAVGPIEDDMLPPPPAAAAAPPEDRALPHVLFVAGVDESTTVKEVAIDGRAHGALSYSTAQALSGAADADGNGEVSLAEFQHYLRQSVRLNTDGRQAIQLEVGGDLKPEAALFKARAVPGGATAPPAAPAMGAGLGGGGSAPASGGSIIGGAASGGSSGGSSILSSITPGGGASSGPLAALPAAAPAARPLALFLHNPQAAPGAESLLAGAPVTLVTAREAADMIWDPSAAQVITGRGDVVATFPDPTPAAQAAEMTAVAAKWTLVERLKAWPEATRLAVTLAPDDGLHHLGDRVTLEVGDHGLPYLTLFNLDPFGGMHFVFPLPEYGDRLDAYADGGRYALEMEVSEPVGGDHFIALATEQPALALHDRLRALDGHPVPPDFLDLLRSHLAGTRFELGLHGVFTAMGG